MDTDFFRFIQAAHDWALGVPLGWVPSDTPDGVIGQVLFQSRIVVLDEVSYLLWTAALIGDVDLARCGAPDYVPPAMTTQRFTRERLSPDRIAAAAQRIHEAGLIWHFDPIDYRGYREAEQFEVAVQGIPLGNVDRADVYRVAHIDGSPALDMDGVAYLVWLQWWSESRLVKAAHTVADDMGMRRLDVVGRAVGLLLAGMRAGLIYISAQGMAS